jgi:hypothetical protein
MARQVSVTPNTDGPGANGTSNPSVANPGLESKEWHAIGLAGDTSMPADSDSAERPGSPPRSPTRQVTTGSAQSEGPGSPRSPTRQVTTGSAQSEGADGASSVSLRERRSLEPLAVNTGPAAVGARKPVKGKAVPAPAQPEQAAPGSSGRTKKGQNSFCCGMFTASAKKT